jgi:predicted esterase YcpF (UPF0227 family)
MKKVLYLHGLESDQGGPKVDYLSSKYLVCAPKLDYKDPNCFQNIFDLLQDDDFDLIIGSSMGGYLGFIMGEIFEISTILFNPAVHSRSFEPNNQFKPKLGNTAHYVVLGGKDDLIHADQTVEYLDSYGVIYNKSEIPTMAHQIPLDIFIDKVSNRVKELEMLTQITEKF